MLKNEQINTSRQCKIVEIDNITSAVKIGCKIVTETNNIKNMMIHSLESRNDTYNLQRDCATSEDKKMNRIKIPNNLPILIFCLIVLNQMKMYLCEKHSKQVVRNI